MTPLRIQLRRTKGWRMPENTVKVCRGPGMRFGNPFDLRRDEHCWTAISVGCKGDRRGRQEASVKLFREWLTARSIGAAGRRRAIHDRSELRSSEASPSIAAAKPPTTEEVASLRGNNLACWCSLCPAHADGKPLDVECADCAPCHADVLLELANAEPRS